MPRIQQLSQSIINKIAAGEVIERPASVVKELVENSIDAGATRVDVTIENGGRDMIRIVDNGSGIEAEQLPLAIASHATSKIESADDLFSVGTLGFRGEALASISEISRTHIKSRTADEEAGAEIEIVGGTVEGPTPCGCPVGTSIEVRNLFFNTPVRRKFLKTTQTEFGHISEAVTRLAMPNPRIHFTLKHNNRIVHDLPAESLFDRIARLVGRQTTDRLIPVESEHDEIRLFGYVGHPKESRSNTKSQYLFLNGRHIRDRSLQHALNEAYRGLLTVGRQPVAYLFLEIPPNLIDVNVHPTKLEVRFQDGGRLYSQLLGTIRTKFLSTDLTTHVESNEPEDEKDPAGAHDAESARQFRQQVIDWATNSDEDSSGGASSPNADFPRAAAYRSSSVSEATGGSNSSGTREPLRLHTLSGDEFLPFPDPNEYSRTSSGSPGLASPQQEASTGDGNLSTNSPPALSPAHAPRAIQIHNKYIVTESSEGLVVIDQHALHERILFERLKARMESSRVETQKLLVPEPVDLSPAEMALATENKDALAEIGLTTEPFGGETLLVTGYPTLLKHLKPEEILRAILESLEAVGKTPERTALMDGLLETMACKAAIKAGDPLAPDEIDALLAQRTDCDDAHHCPHGRPSQLVFRDEELDKQFKRL